MLLWLLLMLYGKPNIAAFSMSVWCQSNSQKYLNVSITVKGGKIHKVYFLPSPLKASFNLYLPPFPSYSVHGNYFPAVATAGTYFNSDTSSVRRPWLFFIALAFSSVQFSRSVVFFATAWIAALQALALEEIKSPAIFCIQPTHIKTPACLGVERLGSFWFIRKLRWSWDWAVRKPRFISRTPSSGPLVFLCLLYN